MTVLTKPSITVKKTLLIDENRCDEEVIDIQPSEVKRRYKCAVVCMGLIAAMLLFMGALTAMQMYDQITKDLHHHRYQGFCAIPLSRDTQMLEPRKAPLRWRSATDSDRPDQVINLLEEDPDHLFDLLREMLDIDIDDSVEKITVLNGGNQVSFVHDFESNITGIVDSERCFTMELDPELVLQPELLLFGMRRGDEFDVSRVRSQLRAVLPPAAPPAAAAAPAPAATRALRDKCVDKPVYTLQKDDAVVIRKRSADAPPHDYIQFAGKRIQEIEISNLAELLEYEQKIKLGA